MAEKDAEGLELEVVPLASLRPHPRNYRAHPPDQIMHLVQSIKEHGFYRNVVVARDGTILAGHGVVLAAKEMGLEDIPVHRLDVGSDDVEALKVLVGDNEIEHLAYEDDRALTEMLLRVQSEDEHGLLGTGHDAESLAELIFITRGEGEVEDIQDARSLAGLTEVVDQTSPELVVNFRNLEDRVAFLRLFDCQFQEDGHDLVVRWGDDHLALGKEG